MWDAPNQFEELQAQLTSMKFEYTRKGQVKVESKDAMKMRGFPSLDMADSLSICLGRPHGNVQDFAMPVPGATPVAEQAATATAPVMPSSWPYAVAHPSSWRTQSWAWLASAKRRRVSRNQKRQSRPAKSIPLMKRWAPSSLSERREERRLARTEGSLRHAGG